MEEDFFFKWIPHRLAGHALQAVGFSILAAGAVVAKMALSEYLEDLLTLMLFCCTAIPGGLLLLAGFRLMKHRWLRMDSILIKCNLGHDSEEAAVWAARWDEVRELMTERRPRPYSGGDMVELRIRSPQGELTLSERDLEREKLRTIFRTVARRASSPDLVIKDAMGWTDDMKLDKRPPSPPILAPEPGRTCPAS